MSSKSFNIFLLQMVCGSDGTTYSTPCQLNEEAVRRSGSPGLFPPLRKTQQFFYIAKYQKLLIHCWQKWQVFLLFSVSVVLENSKSILCMINHQSDSSKTFLKIPGPEVVIPDRMEGSKMTVTEYCNHKIIKRKNGKYSHTHMYTNTNTNNLFPPFLMRYNKMHNVNVCDQPLWINGSSCTVVHMLSYFKEVQTLGYSDYDVFFRKWWRFTGI
jgi:hypothetical protein